MHSRGEREKKKERGGRRKGHEKMKGGGSDGGTAGKWKEREMDKVRMWV